MRSIQRTASPQSRRALTRTTILATVLLVLGLMLAATASAGAGGPNGVANVRAVDDGARLPVPALPNAPLGKSTIGNYVWHDFNANGDHVGDAPEMEFTAGFDGVTLELWRYDTNLSAWVLDGTTTTGDDPNTAGTQTGWYQFPATADPLGIQYEVRVPASNFAPGGPLAGYVLTSAGTYPEPFSLVGTFVDYKDADFGYARTSLTVTKSPPTQTLLPGSTATFQLVIKNTGEVDLENIVITENLAGATCTPNPIPGPLAPNATANATCTYTMGAQAVQNTVTVTGTPTDGNGTPFPGTPPTADSNPVDVLPANPAIQVVKEVSVDGGLTWQDANSPTGPTLTTGTNPQFRFTITNTGNVTLTNITLTDSVYTVTPECVPPASLAPAATYQCVITRPWAVGQHTNTATTTGKYTDDSGVTATPTPTDTDNANYFGANPAIQVVKEVSLDGGLTWQDANSPTGPVGVSNPQFRFTITNIGNVTLTNITLTDSVYTVTPECVPPASLAPAATYQCVITRPWAVGQHTNTATTTGTYTDGGGHQSTPSDTDDANYYGADPKIQVVKEVSVDGGLTWQDANTVTGPYAGSGVTPQFRFTITNIGNVTLTNITLTDSVYTLTPECVPPASLAPAATYQCIITRPWSLGQHTNTATTTGTFSDPVGVLQVSDTDDANYFGANPAINLVKTAGNAPDGSPLVVAPPVPVIVVYTYVLTNQGNVPVFVDKTGVDPVYKVTDDKCSPVTYVSGDLNNDGRLDVNETWTFTCTASLSVNTINTGSVTGKPTDPSGNPIPGTTDPKDSDTAEVQINFAVGDRVWWDVNGNGVQDAGEPGIPGVTLNMTGFPPDVTDANGIYTFTNVPPGSHTIIIPTSMFTPGAPLEGFTVSPTGQGTPATDSNGVVTANGVEATFTLPPNTSDLTIDYGFVKPTSYRVEKKRITQSPTTPSNEVHFQITVYNTGATWITTLPLVDTYDSGYLTYGYNANYASPASTDNVDDGTINWADITGAGALAPAANIVVDVYFTAKNDTLKLPPDGVTINTATVPQQGTKVDADGPQGPIPPADSPLGPQEAQANVQIINPTGVVLARAGVRLMADGVRVTWETADERTLLGFNILRGANAQDLQAVTGELVLAQRAGESGGATYSYLDAAGTGAYYYVLELVGLDGTVRRIDLGMVTVR